MEDQRFVTTRPDVVSFIMDSLTRDITVTGKVMAHLFASTSGTDADFAVKLIDVYPAIDTASRKMTSFICPSPRSPRRASATLFRIVGFILQALYLEGKSKRGWSLTADRQVWRLVPPERDAQGFAQKL